MKGPNEPFPEGTEVSCSNCKQPMFKTLKPLVEGEVLTEEFMEKLNSVRKDNNFYCTVCGTPLLSLDVLKEE